MSAQSIVLSNGHFQQQIGLAGQKSPILVTPSCTGFSGFPETKRIIGDWAYEADQVHYHFDRRMVSDWSEMKHVWQYEFDRLPSFDSKASSLLVTDYHRANSGPCRTRQLTAEVVFEQFEFGKMCLMCAPLLAQISSGILTGLNIDWGQGNCMFLPVQDGHIVEGGNTISALDIGGVDLNKWLQKSLLKIGAVECLGNNEVVRQIKEQYCYVAEDYEAELKKKVKSPVTLPDGTELDIGKLAFECPEMAFSNQLSGSLTIPQMFMKLWGVVKPELHKVMWQNLTLTGGCTLFRGLQQRLGKELKREALSNADQKNFANDIHFHTTERYAAWIGGSIFAALPTYEQKCVTKAEWLEVGSPIFQKKCFN